MVTHIILLTFMLVVIVVIVSVAPGIKNNFTFKNVFDIFTVFTYIVLST